MASSSERGRSCPHHLGDVETIHDVLLGVHVVGGTVSMVIYGSAGSRKSKRWRAEGQCLKTKRIFRRMGHDCKSQVGVLINGITT
jgi:hypothetical protein